MFFLNFYIFFKVLASTTVGTLEFRTIIEPIRTARSHLNYIQADCVGVDVERKLVNCEGIYAHREGDLAVKPKFDVRFDKLVIAVGAVTNTFNIPGVDKYCYMLKQLSDARAIRQRLLGLFIFLNSAKHVIFIFLFMHKKNVLKEQVILILSLVNVIVYFILWLLVEVQLQWNLLLNYMVSF